MKKHRTKTALLFLLVALMFLASGVRGSYFCVSPWSGDGPISGDAVHAHR
jgi:hypothetical protein